jgi:ribonuclease HI
MPETDVRPRVTIYTDGGADPNPGPGGWGAVLIHDATGHVKKLSGSDPNTTNNRMELTAAIEALSALKQPCDVHLYTDSEYLKLGITERIGGWQAKGFNRVKNADLWKWLVELSLVHDITWEWVKGHAGNHYNELADRLATQAIRSQAAGEPVPDSAAEAEVYTVVSARDHQGFWAASIRIDGDEQLITGHEFEVTANQLDIMAVIEALCQLPEGISVSVYSLSDYLRNGASQWILGWKKRGWQTKSGEPVKNRELWQRLDELMSRRKVSWPSVKDDPTFEFAFEELGRRAQESFAEMIEEPHPSDYDPEF